jgi:hypothetical protein
MPHAWIYVRGTTAQPVSTKGPDPKVDTGSAVGQRGALATVPLRVPFMP